MNKFIIKKLSSMTIEAGNINEDIKNFVFSKFSRADLKKYLLYLKEEIKTKQVNVKYAGDIDISTRQSLSELFTGKEIIYEPADSFGAGLQIAYDDNIVSLNLKNMIERTIKKLKEEL